MVKQDSLWWTGGQWYHHSCPGGASPNSTYGLLLGQGKNLDHYSLISVIATEEFKFEQLRKIYFSVSTADTDLCFTLCKHLYLLPVC